MLDPGRGKTKTGFLWRSPATTGAGAATTRIRQCRSDHWREFAHRGLFLRPRPRRRACRDVSEWLRRHPAAPLSAIACNRLPGNGRLSGLPPPGTPVPKGRRTGHSRALLVARAAQAEGGLRSRRVGDCCRRPPPDRIRHCPRTNGGQRLISTASRPRSRLSARQARTAPLVAAFGTWLSAQRRRVSAKSRLGEKLAYIHNHWNGLQTFLADGRIVSRGVV